MDYPGINMPNKLKKDTPLKRKQKKFISGVVQHGNVSKAAALAGYGSGYGYHLTKQPKIQTALQLALDEAGLGDSKIASLLKAGSKAYYVKKDGGEKYPDFHARDKTVDKLIKVHGGYAPEKHEIKQEKLVLIITPETIKGLLDAKAIKPEDVKEILEEGE